MLLCLDMGFGKTGWSIFHGKRLIDCGCLITQKTKKKNIRVSDDNADRSAQLAGALKSLVCDHNIEGVVAEIPSGGAKSARAMRDMGMCTAIVAATMQLLDLPIEYYTPREVKIAITGKANASKQEIIDEAQASLEAGAVTKNRTTYYGLTTSEGVRRFPKGQFEHIADSVGTYYAARTGNMVRMFG